MPAAADMCMTDMRAAANTRAAARMSAAKMPATAARMSPANVWRATAVRPAAAMRSPAAMTAAVAIRHGRYCKRRQHYSQDADSECPFPHGFSPRFIVDGCQADPRP
jgi:hypothetical protein